ncbi:MAG: hypothetical protein ACSNEK_01360 [Parachlamydiaceae bacterium]
MTTIDPLRNGINPSPYLNEATAYESAIDSIPLEIFQEFLTKLDKESVQSALLVDSSWREATINAIQHRDLSEIKNFAKSLAGKLDRNRYKNQIEKLLRLGRDKKTSDFFSLKQIETTMKELKKEILVILEAIEDQDLDDLEKATTVKPKFFENVFTFAKHRKKIDREWKSSSSGPLTCFQE